MSSPYRDQIVSNSPRAIDWKRGCPYTYIRDDIEELIDSSKLFARKFDINVDSSIVEMLASYLTSRDEVSICS